LSGGEGKFSVQRTLFHTNGRFVCLGKAKPGEMVVSEFDLDSGFKRYFDKRQTSAITGIALGVDTARTAGAAKMLRSSRVSSSSRIEETPRAMAYSSIPALPTRDR